MKTKSQYFAKQKLSNSIGMFVIIVHIQFGAISKSNNIFCMLTYGYDLLFSMFLIQKIFVL